MAEFLIFLCQCTRNDVCFALSQAARFMSNPTSVHIGAVKRILRYLHGTPHIHITYSCNIDFQLIGFFGASYGTVTRRMRDLDQGAYTFSLG
ncbi:unnamed protein product, partial [Ascophyllum nodosum]